MSTGQFRMQKGEFFRGQELHPTSESLRADLFISEAEPHKREFLAVPPFSLIGSVPTLCDQPCTLSIRLAMVVNWEEEKDKQNISFPSPSPSLLHMNAVSHCKLFNYLFLRRHLVLFKLSYLVYRYFNGSAWSPVRSGVSVPAYL